MVSSASRAGRPPACSTTRAACARPWSAAPAASCCRPPGTPPSTGWPTGCAPSASATALTPGSDLALANGLLYLAIEEGLIDTAYVAARTAGFEAVRRAVLAYHPAHVERLTGVGEASLRRTVRWLAEARAAMILTGRGP